MSFSSTVTPNFCLKTIQCYCHCGHCCKFLQFCPRDGNCCELVERAVLYPFQLKYIYGYACNYLVIWNLLVINKVYSPDHEYEYWTMFIKFQVSQLFLSDDRLKEMNSTVMRLCNDIIRLETEKKKKNVHSGNRFCILNCILAVFP